MKAPHLNYQINIYFNLSMIVITEIFFHKPWDVTRWTIISIFLFLRFIKMKTILRKFSEIRNETLPV